MKSNLSLNSAYFRQETLVGIEVMQFTGLLDRNGKRIYEGDIVRANANDRFPDDNRVGTIIFGDSLCWEIKHEDLPDSNIGMPMTWGGWESFEVIGNIYENKELIK